MFNEATWEEYLPVPHQNIYTPGSYIQNLRRMEAVQYTSRYDFETLEEHNFSWFSIFCSCLTKCLHFNQHSMDKAWAFMCTAWQKKESQGGKKVLILSWNWSTILIAKFINILEFGGLRVQCFSPTVCCQSWETALHSLLSCLMIKLCQSQVQWTFQEGSSVESWHPGPPSPRSIFRFNSKTAQKANFHLQSIKCS